MTKRFVAGMFIGGAVVGAVWQSIGKKKRQEVRAGTQGCAIKTASYVTNYAVKVLNLVDGMANFYNNLAVDKLNDFKSNLKCRRCHTDQGESVSEGVDPVVSKAETALKEAKKESDIVKEDGTNDDIIIDQTKEDQEPQTQTKTTDDDQVQSE